VVVVDALVPPVASCSGLSIDAELTCDNRIVTFYMLENTIDALIYKFSGTYRFELRCTVVKARRRGCPWLVGWEDDPWPPSCGGSLACSSAVLTPGAGPTGGV
jgi:hypothetical protein